MNKSFFLFMLCWIITFSVNAEKPFTDTPEFFKEHLVKKTYDLDTSAAAIVLYEGISTSMESNMDGQMFIVCRSRKIVKIIKKAAVTEGDITVGINSSEAALGTIRNIKGATYNLVNGEMVQQQMPNSSIRMEKEGDYTLFAKFSLPSVTEGSIIDYTYETKRYMSRTIGVWHIQEDYPKLVTEFALLFPKKLNMAMVAQYIPEFVEYDENKSKTEAPIAYATPTKDIGNNTNFKSWVRKNVPAEYEEPYLYNLANYSEKITFSISTAAFVAYVGNSRVTQNYNAVTWENLNSIFRDKNAAFGQLENISHTGIREYLQRIGAKEDNKLEYARKIYRYVRDNFNCKYRLAMYKYRNLEKILDNQSGDPLDCNLVLIAALRKAGMNADPVILATRKSGKLTADYPVAENLDYIITRLEVNGEVYYLDPTDKYHPFGVIPPGCYNGFAWVVNDTGMGIQLDAQQPKEKSLIQMKTVSKTIDNYELGVRKVFSKYDAITKRAEWMKDSLLIKKEIMEEIKSWEGMVSRLVNYSVHNLSNPDTTLIVEYTTKLDIGTDPLFFTPSVFNLFVKAPFVAERRINPIEFTYPLDVNFSFAFALPDGYVFENIPQSKVLKLNEDNFYKYLVNYDETSHTLILNTRFNLQRIFFQTTEYDQLKSFFDKVIEAQGASVIVKKS